MRENMVRKLYWEDSYIREFDASVQRLEEGKIYLDSTAFHPMGGGLVGDSGFLGDIRVTDTRKEGENEISHTFEGIHTLKEGDSVHGVIDWERRYRIMRMHTTAHALSAVFKREAGALITGNQIKPEESRIDFSLENLDKEAMLSYVGEVNEAIQRNLPVKTYFLPREEAVKIPDVIKLAGAAPPDIETFRIVEIEGLDVQADGGVHVRNLGEVKKVIPLKFENKGKSNRRMYFTIEN